MDNGSWLMRDGDDRERMLEMDVWLRPKRRAAFAVLAVALVASGPWQGYWTLVPLLIAGVLFAAAERLDERLARPEYAMFGAWAASEAIIAASVALTHGGVRSPSMAWLAIPIVTLSARFSARGIVAGVGLVLAILAGVAFATDAQAVISNPPLLISPAAVVVAVAILSTALMRSERHHRSEAVIDPLTGMLNRKALANRVSELEEQSAVTKETVGVIVGDLDHFKAINDESGHATGDAVLKDVAYAIRKQLRAFDLAYRIGGEEFLVLVPGGDVGQCIELAEALRLAIGADMLAGGHRVTMSFGVDAPPRGARFDYEACFERADAALYEAKRAGRDRVHASDPLAPALAI